MTPPDDTVPLSVDAASSTAPYEQVRLQVLEHVDSGRLRPGDRLPTVRSLAERLGVAPGTVARTYRELEASGVVVTRGRAGTVVADSAVQLETLVGQATAALVEQLRGAGAKDSAILEAVRVALRS